MQSCSSCLGILGNGTMPRYDDIGSERLHCIQYPKPGDTVTLGHIREFFGKENLAQVSNPVLRNKDDAVASRVSPAKMENVNFLAAEVQGHAITKGHARQ